MGINFDRMDLTCQQNRVGFKRLLKTAKRCQSLAQSTEKRGECGSRGAIGAVIFRSWQSGGCFSRPDGVTRFNVIA